MKKRVCSDLAERRNVYIMKREKIQTGYAVLNIVLLVMSLTYIIPLVMMISISLSSEQSIIDYGYSLFPKVFSLDAYKQALLNPYQIIQSYKVTAFYTVISTILAIFVQSLMGYPLSRKTFKFKRPLLVFIMITMFFSGGMVPSYILNTQYLHLGNTIWIYIIPTLMSAWNVILFKTYFSGLPDSLVEAAKIDGANEIYIYFRIILPLSTPIIATLAFTYALGKWNDWNTSLLYIRDNTLYSLQYLLQRIINEADYVQKMQGTAAAQYITEDSMPNETLRYAMAVLAAGPMMIVFPFFQKYFAKGLVVGSVKG